MLVVVVTVFVGCMLFALVEHRKQREREQRFKEEMLTLGYIKKSHPTDRKYYPAQSSLTRADDFYIGTVVGRWSDDGYESVDDSDSDS